MVSDCSKSTIFQYNMKYSFIYLLVSVLSLKCFRLYIMYMETIAG